METILQINNLKKAFGSKIVLNDINLSLQKGKVMGILGPNGSGKTTLLNLIEGFLKPTEGTVLIESKNAGVETKALTSMLQDKNVFLTWMKVSDGLEFYSDFFRDFDKTKAKELLKSLSISETDKIRNLSKGTLEKFSLALTISRKAKLYILDEPLSGIDPIAREEILELIVNNLDEESSMIITTHLIAELERILDEVVFIKDGSIILQGDTEEIRMERQTSLDKLYRELYRKTDN
ncbi:ABC transporter ATP-binding protein [Clostridium swellfunianum]|uniref:ABC transporter ATP-binding protein n=1 Tax=Clostridium swellfunianum TaxID=1367462 RepID=UPI00202EBB82|nr:ABC transporter ATP-binding protein [Clostridium swellfunianum]MCM0648217.1 ABC transporter ATP-binding protein [Clostridium swellfunianum]